ncbi:(RS)-norcoclaurine 6-O-methyltransferase [Ananas comosus]|uniref:(RS)-norcoclaurine 6-O-methyltransferase n=1 Tax=Ananas comosus TaxID=4615 RepID=A0A199UYQ2_ANACO|nr:(RS)-norcoclaurine 6-O-methyltransferase [Ananas comosus]
MEGGGVGVEAQATVWSHILSLVDSFVLKCAIKLDIIDIIHRRGRPVPATELAASLPVPCASPSALRRIMRYLSHMRLIAIQYPDGGDEAEELYALTPASRFLLKKEEKSLVPFALMQADEEMLEPLHALELCLGGEPAYKKVKGGSVWERASRDAAFNELFNRAMACNTALVADGMVEGCRAALAGVRSLVDVGGGTGTAARAIAVAFPHLRCVVFDLPHVVDSMQKRPGLEYVGGDMFASSVLHDWSDEECLRILKRCKEALPGKGGKLIIVDIVVDDEREHEFARARMATDMLMMVYTGGRERTKKEWNQLVLGAGFASCKIKPIMAMEQMIEAST